MNTVSVRIIHKGITRKLCISERTEGGRGMSFLLCIAKYVVEMVILLGIGLLGAFIGIKLRKHKDAKKAAEATVMAEEKNE